MGPDWDGDLDNDAGNTKETAQPVVVDATSVLVKITGNTKGEDEGLADGEGDFQDMYKIVLLNRQNFSISTVNPQGSAQFNTLLCVFDENGFASLANDNADSSVEQSFVGGESTDGETIVSGPGVVYIAISGAGSKPIDANGNVIFDFGADPSLVVGPSKAGFENPLAGWNASAQHGEYVINLTAVSPVPSGCGAPNAGNCISVDQRPYCQHAPCCESVCTIDPTCCEVRWDISCVNAAEVLCDPSGNGFGCGETNSGSCYESHKNARCDDAACCALVCQQTPDCCLVQWDTNCAELAMTICMPSCNSTCLGDINSDGLIDGADLANLLGVWNTKDECADLNDDGTVDGADLTVLLGGWGSCK